MGEHSHENFVDTSAVTEGFILRDKSLEESPYLGERAISSDNNDRTEAADGLDQLRGFFDFAHQVRRWRRMRKKCHLV
ncbi:unnamed protein product [Soboliphyme baturini]|uniref:Uncharacterized protein n=1 Tax=Soboliphyme baturini TaxID=241478 RepID=A0A183J826_9BILA|nr:unnamed protein product [Soboliphyme baturini]